MSTSRLLLVEDDTEAARWLKRGLEAHGYQVAVAEDGAAGLAQARQHPFDLLVVDRMLPRLDGLTMIERLRESGDTTPVLILSALGEVDDRVAGLRAGGDDYLVKPYAFDELLARLEALLRRARAGEGTTRLRIADLELNLDTRKVHRAGRPIHLQPRECQLLEFLMRHAGQLVTRRMLLEQVWDLHFDPGSNLVDAQISRLRSKIDKGFDKPLLHTVRGRGYCLET